VSHLLINNKHYKLWGLSRDLSQEKTYREKVKTARTRYGETSRAIDDVAKTFKTY